MRAGLREIAGREAPALLPLSRSGRDRDARQPLGPAAAATAAAAPQRGGGWQTAAAGGPRRAAPLHWGGNRDRRCDGVICPPTHRYCLSWSPALAALLHRRAAPSCTAAAGSRPGSLLPDTRQPPRRPAAAAAAPLDAPTETKCQPWGAWAARAPIRRVRPRLTSGSTALAGSLPTTGCTVHTARAMPMRTASVAHHTRKVGDGRWLESRGPV
jgi:hypothetical protein